MPWSGPTARAISSQNRLPDPVGSVAVYGSHGEALRCNSKGAPLQLGPYQQGSADESLAHIVEGCQETRKRAVSGARVLRVETRIAPKSTLDSHLKI